MVAANNRICNGTTTAPTTDDSVLARNSPLPARQHNAIPRATKRANVTTFIVPSAAFRRQ